MDTLQQVVTLLAKERSAFDEAARKAEEERRKAEDVKLYHKGRIDALTELAASLLTNAPNIPAVLPATLDPTSDPNPGKISKSVSKSASEASAPSPDALPDDEAVMSQTGPEHAPEDGDDVPDHDGVPNPVDLRFISDDGTLQYHCNIVKILPQQFRILEILVNSRDGYCSDVAFVQKIFGVNDPRTIDLRTILSRLNADLKRLNIPFKLSYREKIIRINPNIE